MSTTASSSKAPTVKSKQGTACTACRRSKMKCTRKLSETGSCDKCLKTGRECVVVPSKMGRKLGSKNKFTELNHALRNLDKDTLQTILGPAADKLSFDDKDKPAPIRKEKNMINGIADKNCATTSVSSSLHQQQVPVPSLSPSSARDSSSNGDHTDFSPISLQRLLPSDEYLGGNSVANNNRTVQKSNEMTTNPLGLLSQICTDSCVVTRQDNGLLANTDFLATLASDSAPVVTNNDLTVPMSDSWLREGYDYIFENQDSYQDKPFAYFDKSIREPTDADDKDLDPIYAGVVSEDEVDALFEFYYRNLASISFALDPNLCTPSFVRKTSPFLLTAVAYTASQFAPCSNKAMSRRLYLHFIKAANTVIIKRYKSSSIIHAFLIGVGHISPAEYFTQENAWTFYCNAHSIAHQLGIHSLWLYDSPQEVFSYESWETELHRHSIEPNTEQAAYLAKHVERSYLHLFLWGSGLASSLDLPWKIKSTEFSSKRLASWVEEPYAMKVDYIATSVALLRQRYTVLMYSIKSGNFSYETMCQQTIESLNDWYSKQVVPLLDDNGAVPRAPVYIPFIVLIFKHTKLLLKSLLLKHCVADISNSLRPMYDCFRSALAVVEFTVTELEASAALKYVTNNISMCILYSAVGILKFGSYLEYQSPDVNARIISLLGQLSRLLEWAGSTPSHRNGITRLFGRYLRAILVSNATEFKNKGHKINKQNDQYMDISNDQQVVNQSENMNQPNIEHASLGLDHWLPFESGHDWSFLYGISEPIPMGNLLNFTVEPSFENNSNVEQIN